MPVPAMAETVIDHQKRFQAAVDVIHNLPKNGFYRPSYEMMLRFYSLYKQAVCGPCAVPRPGFWDPVGRYKWDAWSELGQMSSESAMAAYVNEIKKVAQEVIDTMPMNEKTASLLHHFEPLYLVIDDMPRPPESLLALRQGGEHVETPSEVEDEDPQGADPDQEVMANTVLSDSGVSKALVLNSDSESEIFCDSVDSVEQLSNIKVSLVKSNGFNKVSLSSDSSAAQSPPLGGCMEVRQVGAGQGGEGADDGNRRGRTTGQERTDHSWRERGAPRCSVRRAASDGGGAGQGGGDGSEGGMERLRNPQLQQQIIAALRRLRDDMRSVMIRLEVVERLAASHTLGGSEWRPCMHCAAAASQQQEESWWPFDVSAPTVLLFLLWPFVAQGLLYLLRKTHKRRRVSS